MPTNMEMSYMQKNALYDLLLLKLDMETENSGVNLKYLNRLINKTVASMEAEDVAWVEKQIASLE
ncbi:MAG: hypothetical protein FWG36_10215 [Oscillospiraceae bacterium]|nr:hypothetical protein [Oscillospiraceae bacterium]